MMTIAEKLSAAGFGYTTTIIRERGKVSKWLRIERPGKRLDELMALLGDARMEICRYLGEVEVVEVRVEP